MRKVIVEMSVSVDGFVAPASGAPDHRSASEDPALKQRKLDWLRHTCTHAMGRVTYQQMLALAGEAAVSLIWVRRRSGAYFSKLVYIRYIIEHSRKSPAKRHIVRRLIHSRSSKTGVSRSSETQGTSPAA
jgi:hypothetical protein